MACNQYADLHGRIAYRFVGVVNIAVGFAGRPIGEQRSLHIEAFVLL
jgi:hypothetical protein